MKQLVFGAALVGIGTVIGAVSSDNTNGQPTPSSLHPAFNQVMHCGTCQGSVNKGGSYMPTTVGYGRVTWIK